MVIGIDDAAYRGLDSGADQPRGPIGDPHAGRRIGREVTLHVFSGLLGRRVNDRDDRTAPALDGTAQAKAPHQALDQRFNIIRTARALTSMESPTTPGWFNPLGLA